MQALIDCGATGCFIDIEWAKLNNVPTHTLSKPIPVYNINGTTNDAGAITDIADIILHYENHSEHTQLAVTCLGKQSLILGYNWLQNHNPEINWQTKDVKMSCCPLQSSTCRVEDKRNVKMQKSTTSQINACQSGAFPTMAEEDEDESPHMDIDETDEEAQDTGLAFDDDLDSEVNDFTIEEDDRIFMVMVHLVDPHHFVHASSMVSGCLAEVFAKNAKPKGFEDIVLMSLHTYANVFSETAFDSLPEHRKWDHTIELEHEPSPGFCKVYPMTLTEQTEMDAFLEEALATGHIRQSKSPLGAPVFFIKKKDGKCKGTSLHFLTFPLLSSIILHFPLLYHTHSCSYVHSPTLSTITRCQTLEVNDSWTDYCHRHPTPPSTLTSGASDRLRTHWDRST
jgi:hypothetical protein